MKGASAPSMADLPNVAFMPRVDGVFADMEVLSCDVAKPKPACSGVM